jgi:uncharacterized protein YuzE
MKYEYNPHTDVLIIQMKKGKPDHGEQVGNVITHYSKDGTVVELEILDASREAANMITAIMKSKQSAAADSK